MAPPARVWCALGLGGNLGDVAATFLGALASLRGVLEGLEVGGLYLTAPHSPVPQPDFLNTVVVGWTHLSPRRLLAFSRALEDGAGRTASPPLRPRPLDLDILLWGEATIESPELAVPHPRLTERRFVLAPLADVAPDARVPPRLERVAALLATCSDRSRITRIPWPEPPPSG